MPRLEIQTVILFSFAILPLMMASELECPLPETTGNEADDISICALCSDTDAAMKWNIREGPALDMFYLEFECVDENGSVVLETEQDSCFEEYPENYPTVGNEIPPVYNGTTVVDSTYLRPGIQCRFYASFMFSTIYSLKFKMVDCTIQTPERCREDPEVCLIDRIRRDEGDETCGYQCGNGFSGNRCENINECAGNHTCHDNATCRDTIGSYRCECLPGFQGDGYDNCTNINECVGNHSCHEDSVCHDGDGSYWCECLQGFEGDGFNCANVSECEANEPCTENAECNIIKGRHTCQCVLGFTGDPDNCTNINECLASNLSCSENALCRDTYGSFQCHCPPGFEGDGYNNCTSINECERNHMCHENATCIDTEGSYRCECLPGFHGDGQNCSDIDECEGVILCDQNAECQDYIASYWCQCLPGFTGDGYNCSDINECDDSDFLCSEHSTCNDTFGSYSCQCLPGFQGDGYITCNNINECARDNLCHENAECNDTDGSYGCLCKSGFTGNGFNCTDIDECAGNLTCHEEAECNNTVGSFSCLCRSGFHGDGYKECTKDGGVDLWVVVIPGVIAATLVVLIISLVVLPTVILGRLKKEKRPSFLELTKMDLDPQYEPKFWRGSLHSIRSMYERLILSDPTTMTMENNIGLNDDKIDTDVLQQPLTEIRQDTVSTNCEYTRDGRQRNVLGESSEIAPLSETRQSGVSHSGGGRGRIIHIPYVASLPPVPVVAPTIGFNNNTFDVPEEITILMEEEDEEEEEEKEEEHKSSVIPAIGEYVQEFNCTDPSTMSHIITEGESQRLKPEASSSSSSNNSNCCELLSYGDGETPVIAQSYTCTSGYQSESTMNENTKTIGGNSTQKPNRSDRSSSGYGTDSEGIRGLMSPTDYELNLPVWNSESSLDSSDTATISTESEELDTDAIKFTINSANQEFDYVNTLEKTSFAKIRFQYDTASLGDNDNIHT